jgi:hypothetical protein
MRKILVDTNFIIYCAKQKIDFFLYTKLNGFLVLVPEEVINELTKLEKGRKIVLGKNAQLAKKIINLNDFKSIKLENPYVDNGIIKYLKENPEIILATVDKELQNKVKNPVLMIREKIKLEIFNR